MCQVEINREDFESTGMPFSIKICEERCLFKGEEVGSLKQGKYKTGDNYNSDNKNPYGLKGKGYSEIKRDNYGIKLAA